MVVWWTVEKRVRWSHWSIARIGDDSSTSFNGKYYFIFKISRNTSMVWEAKLFTRILMQYITDSSITLKRSLAFTLRRRSPSSLLYSAQVRIYATKYSGASPFTHISTCTAGFVSNREPHAHIYGVPENLPTLHSQLDCYKLSGLF